MGRCVKILVLNAGSSSHKLSLFDLQNENSMEPLWKGELDWGRNEQPISLSVKTAGGAYLQADLHHRDVEEGIKKLLESLWQGDTKVIEGPQSIVRIGHRVVHGGDKFEQPTLIDPRVKEAIRQLIPLAPLHNPANLLGIELMEEMFPSLRQIAVFDTAFHVTMPEIVKTYPVPWQWREKGVQRYGFHGISHQYCSERAAQFLNKDHKDFKMINCHLGNGCSLCAIQEGKSYETTMGLTPLEGLMMGTRGGSIDPGILLYLLREHKISLEDLDQALNFSSGLQGIAGLSDMRDLLNKQEARAVLAVQMFIHRLKTAIGAMAVSLGGVDVLSFTAGIGENAPLIREETCRGLACLNVAIDVEKNRVCEPDADISIASSPIRVLVLRTREEWMIARACSLF